MLELRRPGATVEYGLIITTVAIVVLLGTGAFGPLMFWWFGELAEHITTVLPQQARESR